MKNKDDDATAENNGQSIAATVEETSPAETAKRGFRLPSPSLDLSEMTVGDAAQILDAIGGEQLLAVQEVGRFWEHNDN